MKFEEFKNVVFKAVKGRQDADIQVAQALLDFDLTTVSEAELAILIRLAEAADIFTWKGISSITSEKWNREGEKRKAEEAALAALEDRDAQ